MHAKRKKRYLMLIRYWAKATDSALPVMVIVLSMLPLDPPPLPPLMVESRSSQLEMRIMAPLSCLYIIQMQQQSSKHRVPSYLISAILEPPFPIIHPISSFGTVISCVCCVVCGLPCCCPASATDITIIIWLIDKKASVYN